MRLGSLLAVLVACAFATAPVWAQEVGDDGTNTSVSVAPVDIQPPVIGQAGLTGRVVVAGRCPVPVGGDDACPDRPFPTTVLIRSADGQQQLASLSTADDGTFSIVLQAGQYRVDPILSDGNPPAVSSVIVDVPGGAMVPLTIRIRGGTAVRVP